MKKIILFMFLVLAMMSLVCAEIQSEYYDTGNNTYYSVRAGKWHAQTFTIGTTGENETFGLEIISVYLSKTGTPTGTFNIYLLAVNSSDAPTGNALTQATINLGAITAGVAEWFNYTIPSYTLNAGGKYAIAINGSGGDGANYVEWLIRQTTGAYAGGNGFISTNDAVSWGTFAGDDTMFRLFGSKASIISTNLISPVNNSVFSVTSITFNSTLSPVFMNLTNATIYVWNSTGIFNKTTNSVTGNITNSTSWTINNFILGKYYWNVLGCGTNETSTICGWAENYTFEVGAEIISETYNLVTYETAKETFEINISQLPGTSLISAFLWYGGTPYVISDIKTEGTVKTLIRTIDIPLNPNSFQNITKDFYWSFVFSNEALTPQNTTTRQQNVSYIALVNCNATYSITAVNFTVREEKNPQPEMNSTFHTAWQYWLGDGNIKKSYAWENTTENNSQFKFCIYPSDIVLKSNLDLEYTKIGYSPRTYYLRNATLSNTTNEIKLLLLDLNQSQKFFFTVTRNLIPLSDVIVIISKYDVGLGSYQTIGIRKTDGVGRFVEYLELDKEYRFSISQNLQFLGLIEKTSVCSVSPCEINLEITDEIFGLYQGFYDYYADNIAYNLTYNPNTKLVSYTFIDLTGLAQYFRLQVNKVEYNQSGALIYETSTGLYCNKTLYTTAGTITCNMTGYSGNIIAQGFVSRSPEKLVAIITALLEAIAEIIGKSEGLFFTLIVIVILAFVGAWNPAVGIVLAVAALFLSFVMGFVAISYTAIIAIIILAIIVIIKMGGTRV